MESKTKGLNNAKVKKMCSTNVVPRIQCKIDANIIKESKGDSKKKESTDNFKKRPSTILVSDFCLNSDIVSLQILKKEYTNYQQAKCSAKTNGPVKSFAYNSYVGLVKENNEDKVSVSGQVRKNEKSKLKVFPKISYFGIFDGHGGESCSTFLAENYLEFLCEDKNFPFDMKNAIIGAFDKCESEFLKKNDGKNLEDMDCSGSCALVTIVFDNRIYIGNIGDSRAILSANNGKNVKVLTTDHKPNDIKEYERAIKNGSQIYLDKEDGEKMFITEQKQIDKYIKKVNKNNKNNEEAEDEDEILVFRESPSDLAVMRTIGDIKAKRKEYGANPGSIISKPDVFVYDCVSSDDFIVMGCDGIFDDLTNEQIISSAWFVYKNLAKQENYNIHTLTQNACDIIIKYGMDKLTGDNLSCIVIGMEGLEKFLANKCCKEKIKNEMIESKKK